MAIDESRRSEEAGRGAGPGGGIAGSEFGLFVLWPNGLAHDEFC